MLNRSTKVHNMAIRNALEVAYLFFVKIKMIISERIIFGRGSKPKFEFWKLPHERPELVNSFLREKWSVRIRVDWRRKKSNEKVEHVNSKSIRDNVPSSKIKNSCHVE